MFFYMPSFYVSLVTRMTRLASRNMTASICLGDRARVCTTFWLFTLLGSFRPATKMLSGE